MLQPPHSVTRAVVCRFPGYNCCHGGVVTCEAWMNGPKAAMYAYPDESVRNDGSTFDTMIQVCCLSVRGSGCAPACVSVSARPRPRVSCVVATHESMHSHPRGMSLCRKQSRVST
jgi:hypothetical protein